MAIARNSLFVLSALLVLCISAMALAATVHASSKPSEPVNCSGDGNSSGFIERFEVIAVIRAYLDGTPCLGEPGVTDWTASVTGKGISTYTVLSRSQSANSPWWLNLECGPGDVPSLYFGLVWEPVYTMEPAGGLDVVLEIDGDARVEYEAHYSPAHGSFSDYLRFVSPEGLVKVLYEVETLSIELPDGESALFHVSGLEQRVAGVSEVCGASG